MRINYGFNVEKINRKFNKLFLRVLAEGEGNPSNPNNANPNNQNNATPNNVVNNGQQAQAPQINYEDLISKARQEEKNKLYPQINALNDKVKALTEKSNAHLLTIGEKEAEIARLNDLVKSLEKGGDSKEVSELKNEVSTLKATIADMEKNTISREDLEAEIKAEYEVKLYREQKLRDVDSSLVDLVSGTTKEEIDQSVVKAQEVYNNIQNKIMGSVSVPSANVSSNVMQVSNVNIEDIMKLDPRSPEYAQMRQQLGLN